jgi:hypothetical protein
MDTHHSPPRPTPASGDAKPLPPLTALARLEYGTPFRVARHPSALDLAAWAAAAAEYGLPALRVLTARSMTGFTVDGQGGSVGPSGQQWVAGVLAALPRLERLVLANGMPGARTDDRPMFACRSRYSDGPAPCELCRQPTACAGATAVRDLIVRGLPAAGAAAGRALAVVLREYGIVLEWTYNRYGASHGSLACGRA